MYCENSAVRLDLPCESTAGTGVPQQHGAVAGVGGFDDSVDGRAIARPFYLHPHRLAAAGCIGLLWARQRDAHAPTALLSLRERTGPGGTYGDASDAMTSAITVALAEARTRGGIATRNRDGVAESLQQSSGVDLNTEAAEMLRLQQAFQANARIIQTARDTFEAILAAGR